MPRDGSVALVPARDVALRDGGFLALSREPWLTIEAPVLLAARDRFVAITYRASWWDEPVRPVFRFHLAGGASVDHLAAGPVAGAGIWTGRVPADAVRVGVSPTCRPGPFGFRIEAIRRRAWLELFVAGWRRHARPARSALLTRLIGWKPESDSNLAWALGSTPLADYPAWRRVRARPLDLEGIDAPRFAWDAARPIHLFIDARCGADGLAATLGSLRAQVFSRWTACVLGEGVPASPPDPRLAADAEGTGAAIIGCLRAGDRLEPHALACIAEAAERHPSCSLFYGDAEDLSGTYPVFEPSWSPLCQGPEPLARSGVFVRRALLGSDAAVEAFVQAAFGDERREAGETSTGLPALDHDAVHLLHRVLMRAPAAPRARGPVAAPSAPGASAAIVIPTRDQPARLRQAIGSVRRLSGPRPPVLVVVDNGSARPDTKELLDALERDGVRVLRRPGPFNFSQLCNEGAAAAGAVDVLVFLNDDTEVLGAGWLQRLAGWALQPAVGAVGARLTYPDGRLQHIGVVLGMGGSAGHFGAFAPADASGWAERNRAAFPVSAVTGACLAVARRKFEAVGGFDAANLPVELSDIDLCLRLAERGWSSLVDPAVHLRHDESATRGGATFRRATVYEGQRAYFQQRWLPHLRDDPCFHPGLSLFNWEAALA